MKYFIILIAMCIVIVSAKDDPNSPKVDTSSRMPYYLDNNPGFSIDKHIEARIIAQTHVDKILSISQIEYHRAATIYKPNEKQVQYDTLIISLSLAGDFGFEGAWHGRLIVKKKHDDKDWSKCEVSQNVSKTSSASDIEIEKELQELLNRLHELQAKIDSGNPQSHRD